MLNLRKIHGQAHFRERVAQSDHQQDIGEILQQLICPSKLIFPVPRVFCLIQAVNNNRDTFACSLACGIDGFD